MKLMVKGNYAVVEHKGTQWCFSYGVCIARRTPAYGHEPAMLLTLDTLHHDFSATTRKHRAQFTGLSAPEIRAKIETEEIVLEDMQG